VHRCPAAYPKPHPYLKPIWMQELMHKCSAAKLLFHSLRSEQTTVLGFFLAVENTLSRWQEGFLESAAYPWSPEWLQLCAAMCRGAGVEPLEFPAFANIGMDLPLLPYMTAFEVPLPCSFLILEYGARHSTVARRQSPCPFTTSALAHGFWCMAPLPCTTHTIPSVIQKGGAVTFAWGGMCCMCTVNFRGPRLRY